MKRRFSVFILLITLLIGGFIRCKENSYIWNISSKTYKYIEVLTVSPAQSAVNVPSNVYLSIQFSQSIDTNTFSQSFSMTSDLGNVSLSNYNVI